jgi:hypothetical protein
MFSNWHKGIESSVKGRIRVGVCALVWAIWNCRNDIIFNKISVPKLYAGDLSPFLLPAKEWNHMDSGCTRLAIFNVGG